MLHFFMLLQSTWLVQPICCFENAAYLLFSFEMDTHEESWIKHFTLIPVYFLMFRGFCFSHFHILFDRKNDYVSVEVDHRIHRDFSRCNTLLNLIGFNPIKSTMRCIGCFQIQPICCFDNTAYWLFPESAHSNLGCT